MSAASELTVEYAKTRVQFGQQLAASDGLAGVHVAPDQIAADAEGQLAFLARADLARIGRNRCVRIASDLLDQDRPGRRRLAGIRATGGQQAGGGGDEQSPADAVCGGHGMRPISEPARIV